MEYLKVLFLFTVASCVCFSGAVFGEKIEPPWCIPPQEGKDFTIGGIDNVPDLHGDINNPQLVVFFAGNQFMVVPDVIRAFKEKHPQYQRVFIETLPPGILADQIEQEGLIIGNMRIALAPDIYTGGKGRIERMQKEKGMFENMVDYARNRLAIMVYKGNPKNVQSLRDLGKSDIDVSMPNPKWEGIGKHIIKAYKEAGGKELSDEIMETKVKNGTTFLTHIHHRQTPIRIMKKESDAGPVWFTEVKFQEMIGNPIGLVEIPKDHNVIVTYTAASLKNAPHKEAAADFLKFLKSEKGQSIYRKYHFMPPE
jgi:molybdate transport system substrate-binding protein